MEEDDVGDDYGVWCVTVFGVTLVYEDPFGDNLDKEASFQGDIENM